MANLLSPGVAVTTNDLSQVVQAAGDSQACFSGDFVKGPVNTPTLITSIAELKEVFGNPTSQNYNQWYQVFNFLQYSGEILVTRAADTNGTPKESDLIFNSGDFVGTTNDTKIENTEIITQDTNKIALKNNAKLLKVSDNIKFKNNPDVFTITKVENKNIQVKNPDFVELTELEVSLVKPTFYEDETINFDFTSNGNVTIQALTQGFIEIDEDTKTIKPLKSGSVDIVFTAQKDNLRAKKLKETLTIQARPEVDLIVTPNTISATIGTEEIINVSTSGIFEISNTDDSKATAEIENNTIKINPLEQGQTTLTIIASKEGFKNKEVQVQITINS